MPMTCQICEGQLLDLVYGEIEGAQADQARSHVDGCLSCQKSFDNLEAATRLAAAMPVVTPAASLDAKIMDAARRVVGAEAPAEVRTRAAAQHAEEAEEEGWSLLGWLGSLAMGPQVAMATVMVLVVAIGLWYFPDQNRVLQATGGTVISPDHQGEAQPSGLAPAAPLELALDPRAGRIRGARETDDEVDRRPNALFGDSPEAPAAVAQAEEAPPAALRRPDGLQEGTARVTAGGEGGSVIDGRLTDLVDRPALGGPAPAAPSAVTRDRAAQRPSATRRGYAASSSSAPSSNAGVSPPWPAGVARNDEATEQATPRAPPPAQGIRRERRQAAGSAQRAAPTRARRAHAPSVAAPIAPAPPATRAATDQESEPGTTIATGGAATDSQSTFGRAMRRYRSRDYGGAAEDFSRVLSSGDSDSRRLIPTALHHLARSYRGAGSCQAAINHYRSLLRRFPTYNEAPRALIELADCYRRVGRLAEARSTLEQAQRYASVARQARRELVRLTQTERAADRSDQMPAQVEAAAQAQ